MSMQIVAWAWTFKGGWQMTGDREYADWLRSEGGDVAELMTVTEHKRITQQLEAERDAALAELCGANNRCQLLLEAKNGWADRARKAEADFKHISDEITAMIRMLSNGEWAEHVGQTKLGNLIEIEVTKLVSLTSKLKIERDKAWSELDAFRAAATLIPTVWSQSLSQCWPIDDAEPDGEWAIGSVDEDGNKFAVVEVNAEQYDASGHSERIARAIVALWGSTGKAKPTTNHTQKFLRGARKEDDLVTNDELDKAWGFANFGGMTKREVIRLGTLKCLAGWHQGHTSKTICTELGLISDKYKVTAKGRAYLWLAFGERTHF